jgi:hypothetical protein
MTKNKIKEVDMHRSRFKFLALAVGASMLLWGSIAATPASAAPILFNFSGDVTQVQNLADPPFSVSTGTMTGFFTAESVPSDGSYLVTNFSVTVQGQNYTNVGPFSGVQITNGDPGQDRLDLTVPSLTGPSINADPGPGTVPPADFLMELSTLGNTSVWDSNALPTTMPSISSFNHKAEWRLNFTPGFVRGDITSITAVPLPAAVILFGAGLVALVGLGAGNWRKSQSHSRLA